MMACPLGARMLEASIDRLADGSFRQASTSSTLDPAPVSFRPSAISAIDSSFSRDALSLAGRASDGQK